MNGADMPPSGFREQVRPVVIVPCFNEQHRINEIAFVELVSSNRLALLFVDDGSTDETPTVLTRLMDRSRHIDVLVLPRNSGKGEAVRQGMLRAIGGGAPIVGYLDADLSTPGSEMLRLLGIVEQRPDLSAAFGCRVVRLGTDIERNAFRHYSGRVFATAASITLGVGVYDTQCGAKVFRVNETLAAAIEHKFRSRWSFDVELCQRLLDGNARFPALPVASFLEVPLEKWTDVAGSKLDLWASALAFGHVVALGVSRHAKNWRLRTRGQPQKPN